MRVRFTIIVLFVAAMSVPAWAQKKGPLMRGSRIVRPNPKRAPNLLDRMRKMSPDERRRMMEDLPQDRKKAIEEGLERYDQMSPDERRKLGHQYELFQQMSQERREQLRRFYRRFNDLEEERRPLVREEFQSLQAMTAEQRRSRINSDEFRNKYTGAEQQLLSDMGKALGEGKP
jgi:polyhydroxyalkanoate synthesis regulator phasin